MPSSQPSPETATGFTVQGPPSDTDAAEDRGDLDYLFDGPDLIETREGCERTLRAVSLDTGGADE